MLKKFMKISVLTGMVTLSTLGVGQLSAHAATSTKPSAPTCSTNFSGAQQLVESELSARTTQLGKLQTRVNRSTALSQDDRSSLISILSNEQNGISALSSKVSTDTTCQELKQDAHAMVYDYRVYVVVTPQTDLTVVADSESSIESSMTSLEPVIQSAINQELAKGKDLTAVEQAFASYQSEVTSATSLTSNISSTMLAQVPSGYPQNWQTFLNARTSTETARTNIHSAYSELKIIVSGLK